MLKGLSGGKGYSDGVKEWASKKERVWTWDSVCVCVCVYVCVWERERENNLKILISIECRQNNCFNLDGLAIQTENIGTIVMFFLGIRQSRSWVCFIQKSVFKLSNVWVVSISCQKDYLVDRYKGRE